MKTVGVGLAVLGVLFIAGCFGCLTAAIWTHGELSGSLGNMGALLFLSAIPTGAAGFAVLDLCEAK